MESQSIRSTSRIIQFYRKLRAYDSALNWTRKDISNNHLLKMDDPTNLASGVLRETRAGKIKLLQQSLFKSDWMQVKSKKSSVSLRLERTRAKLQQVCPWIHQRVTISRRHKPLGKRVYH